MHETRQFVVRFAHSFIRYLDKTVEAVDKKITNFLPSQLVLIFDGWIFNSVHYFAIYAAFAGHDASEGTTISLAFSPLLDEKNMDAKSYFDFIVATLNIYKKVDSIMAEDIFQATHCTIYRMR